jgi:hypothetical protein
MDSLAVVNIKSMLMVPKVGSGRSFNAFAIVKFSVPS